MSYADCPKYDIPAPDHELYDLMYGLAELTSHWPQYREAKKKYAGEIDEFSPNYRIAEVLRKSAELYKFNLAATPVKVLRNRLKIAAIQVDKGNQEAFDLIWRANDMEVWLPKIFTTALKYGDAYVRAWTVPEEDSGEEDNDLIEAGVTLNMQHPMTTCVLYDEDTQRRPLYAVKYYRDGKRWRADVEYRDTVEHYRTIADNNKGLKPSDWEPFKPPYTVIDENNKVTIEYADAIEENPHGEITIKHIRTDLPYGVPVHIDAYGPQNAISKLLITQMSVVDTQGWPARYGLTDPAAVLDENNDAPDWDDDEQAPVQDGRATIGSQMRSDPGIMQIMTGIKAAGEWSAAKPEVFTEPVELYVSLMSACTETPLYSFKPGGEQPSGKARQIADAPLEAKKELIQLMFGGFLRELVKLVMKMAEKPTTVVEIEWKPSVLATDVDDWGVIAAKRAEGVPFDTRMVEAGYDPETVKEWAEKAQEYSVPEKIELLGKISAMVKDLDTAVAAGVIDEKTANDILTEVMRDLGFKVGSVPEKEAPPVLGGEINGVANAAGVPVRGQLAGGGKPVAAGPAAGSGGPAKPTDVVGG